jgi:flavin-dependent thymidylate synthase
MSDTSRPTSPGAEEILGKYFPVLDHGFVALVDYMGTDECIERAARVSYGYGTRKASLTRGLLRYLRRHLHTTPSEMVELKFHCAMPMFVARQWIRHRSACLAGDAELVFDVPGAERRGRRHVHRVSIEKFHRMWTRRVPLRERLMRGKLRCCEESSGEMVHTAVADVWESGVKPVFRVTLDNGYALTMSKDHQCLTDRGWLRLEDATSLRVTHSGSVAWDAGAAAFAVNGLPAHQDRDWLAARRAEGLGLEEIALGAGVTTHTIRKSLKRFQLQFSAAERSRLPGFALHGQERVVRRRGSPSVRKLVRQYARVARIEYAGEMMTYDLEVAGPHHNFVANGFIVHNSVNEYSGRYSLMPLLFHMPSADQLQTQSKSNHQGRSGAAVSEAQYREAVERWNRIRAESASAYEWLTSHDIARELARIDLPLSTYTQWYWKIDLHNLLHFLKLRVDAHAQWEIQEYGRVMAGMLKKVAPHSYEAWIDYDVCGARMSRMELDALRRLVQAGASGISSEGGRLDLGALAELGLSKREIEELCAKLQPASVPDFELDVRSAQPPEAFAERMAQAVPKVDKPPVE